MPPEYPPRIEDKPRMIRTLRACIDILEHDALAELWREESVDAEIWDAADSGRQFIDMLNAQPIGYSEPLASAWGTESLIECHRWVRLAKGRLEGGEISGADPELPVRVDDALHASTLCLGACLKVKYRSRDAGDAMPWTRIAHVPLAEAEESGLEAAFEQATGIEAAAIESCDRSELYTSKGQPFDDFIERLEMDGAQIARIEREAMATGAAGVRDDDEDTEPRLSL